jgi:hypothetical protein
VAILCTELKLIIDAREIVYNFASPKHSRIGTEIWRHNPLQHQNYKEGDGRQNYETPELDGMMEPHILGRFENIAFNVIFEHNPYDEPPTFSVYLRHARNITLGFSTDLSMPDLFHGLKLLLSNAPYLSTLSLHVDVAFDLSYDYLDYHLNSDSEEAEHKYMQALFEKVTDLFMDGGATFNTLRVISNVEHFVVDVSLHADWNEKCDVHLPKHMQILHGLKHDIEDNFRKKRILDLEM